MQAGRALSVATFAYSPHSVPKNQPKIRWHSSCPFDRMAKSRDLRIRGFGFSVDVVRLSREHLLGDPIIRRLAYQLVDAAGSVGANLEESGAGKSKADFIAKQFIALKEAREARFWLRVIGAAFPASAPALRPHLQESNELIAMITASLITARSNPHRGRTADRSGADGKWEMGEGKASGS